MRVDPYLYFDGRCEEALDLYCRVLGAQVMALTRFGDSAGTPVPPGCEKKVMHAHVRIGATTVLASDGQCGGKPNFQGFSLALEASDAAEAERTFASLSEGGRVQVPLMTTPFASRFGMVADRFGVLWTVTTANS